MDTSVTRLLVATRQLLEALSEWSKGKVTDEQVTSRQLPDRVSVLMVVFAGIRRLRQARQRFQYGSNFLCVVWYLDGVSQASEWRSVRG